MMDSTQACVHSFWLSVHKQLDNRSFNRNSWQWESIVYYVTAAQWCRWYQSHGVWASAFVRSLERSDHSSKHQSQHWVYIRIKDWFSVHQCSMNPQPAIAAYFIIQMHSLFCLLPFSRSIKKDIQDTMQDPGSRKCESLLNERRGL